MSIGLNDMQNAWQNFNRNNPDWKNNAGGGGGGTSALGFAGLQTPNVTAPKTKLPGINEIELPSWMGKNPDSQMGELLGTYAGIGAAFDPTAQVEARNNAIAYNTSAGGQAANNAATEYAARAQQSGGSGLGAGVVKAQAMMPVLSSNASLKGQAADVAAKAHQDATTLASQIAGTITSLRTNYLNSLTGYAQGQQSLALEKWKAEQSANSAANQTALGWAGLQADLYKTDLAKQSQEKADKTKQYQTILATPQPGAAYITDNSGRVVSGMDSYKQLQQWQRSQADARAALAGMV